MPRKRSVGNREYKQLAWGGGNSGRFQFQDSNWNFDNVCHRITPIMHSNTTANATTSDEPSYSEEEAESTNEKEVENQSVSSSNDLSGESLCSNDSTVSNKAAKHNGNIIIHLPNLESAINSVACCKFCAKSTTISIYASVEMMEYCTHPHDTQTKEALNQAIANVAPKSMCYSGTVSLNSRIAIVIGMHNLGLYEFFASLSTKVGMQMTPVWSRFLHSKKKEKEWKKNYQQWFDVKVRRSKSQKKALQEIYKEHTDVSYGHAIGLPVNNKKRTRQESRTETSTNKPKKNVNAAAQSMQE